MKNRGFVPAVLLALSVLSSCKDAQDGNAMLPAVTGSVNEIMVVMPKPLWDGQVGDSIRDFFGQDQVGLPQSEPVFDLINLPPANFERNARAHRNILVSAINAKADSAYLKLYDSPWARGQKIFKITAPDKESFLRIFTRNREKMMGVFLKAERDRLVGVYRKTPNDKIFNTFKSGYGMLLYAPGGYRINKDTAGFVWLSLETRVNSRGVVFFQDRYVDESQLDYHVIQDRVNEMLKAHIPGPLKNTWMALDEKIPQTAATYRYNDRHYAMTIKGMWTVVNDFMAGPFVLNVVLDEKNNRIIYMMGYVYAPEDAKRNLLLQVESILHSMDVDYETGEEG